MSQASDSAQEAFEAEALAKSVGMDLRSAVTLRKLAKLIRKVRAEERVLVEAAISVHTERADAQQFAGWREGQSAPMITPQLAE